MKRFSKLTSLILVGIMVLGMALTAVAAVNPSPMNDAEKAASAKQNFYSKAHISAGAGSIEEVTDESVLASAWDHEADVESYIRNTLKVQSNKPVWVYKQFLFDVKGIKSGEVSVQLESAGNFDVNQAKGKLAVVDHYNEATKQWERMKDANGNDQLCEIDSEGRITFSFPSYSPIMVSVLNIASSDLKEGATIGVKKYSASPKQVLKTGNSKSPKMGE